MKYRPEIDGLRSVAVVPVILFHAGFSSFSGGFIGVDVFFVISGYLITSIIVSEISKGEFSVAKFYERRARRILPALFVMIFCCIPAAIFLMGDEQFKEFSESVYSTLLFSSNVLFWWQSGYFESSSLLKPLLHTWSLGIEEQFYFILPLLLLAIWRFGLHVVVLTLALVFISSLVISEATISNNPEAGFFLLHNRAWELLAGSLASLYINRFGLKPNHIFSLLGLLLIVVPIFVFDEATTFPGLNALYPVLGTVLLIVCCDEKTFVGVILRWKPLVAMGLISYSAYLWHQPIMVFMRLYAFEHELSIVLQFGSIVATLIFAYLSWKYVEIPFRSRTLLKRRSDLFTSCFSVSLFTVAFVMIGANLHSNIDRRISKAADGDYSYSVTTGDDAFSELGIERITDSQWGEFARWNTANIYKPMGKVSACRVLMFGDSHSNHLSTGMAPVLSDRFGCQVDSLQFAECPGLIGYRKIWDITAKHPEGRAACDAQVALLESYVAKNHENYTHIFLANRVNNLVGPESYDGIKIPMAAYSQNGIVPKNENDRVNNLAGALRHTVQKFAHNSIDIVLFSQPPVQLDDLRDFGGWKGYKAYEAARPSRVEAAERHSLFNKAVHLSGILETPRLYYLDTFDLFCPQSEVRCLNRKSTKSYYSDDDHISTYGAEQIALFLIKRYPSLFASD